MASFAPGPYCNGWCSEKGVDTRELDCIHDASEKRKPVVSIVLSYTLACT